MPPKPKAPSKKRLKEAAESRRNPVQMKHFGRNFPTIISAGSKAPRKRKAKPLSPQLQAFAQEYKRRYHNGDET